MIKEVLLVIVFAVIASGEPWQAAGNFTSENITDIRSVLSSKESQLIGGQLTLQQMAKAISDDLNTKWSTAWNVFVSVPADPANPKDMVQYGYGFNNHWLWYNGYGARNYSYAIWKDYNCVKWVDLYISSPLTTSFIKETS